MAITSYVHEMDEAGQQAKRERRLAVLHLAPEMILSCFRGGPRRRFTFDGLPDDASFVASYAADPTHYPNVLSIVVASPTFAPVPTGVMLPSLDVIATMTQD